MMILLYVQLFLDPQCLGDSVVIHLLPMLEQYHFHCNETEHSFLPGLSVTPDLLIRVIILLLSASTNAYQHLDMSSI